MSNRQMLQTAILKKTPVVESLSRVIAQTTPCALPRLRHRPIIDTLDPLPPTFPNTNLAQESRPKRRFSDIVQITRAAVNEVGGIRSTSRHPGQAPQPLP